jgi:ubiquitin-like protein ATG12
MDLPASPSPVLEDRAPSPEIPLTMSTSAILSSLPRDLSQALATAGDFPEEKVTIRFKPIGSAPVPNRPIAKVSATQKFEVVVGYLRKILRIKDTDSLFLYVNSAFAPSLDEVVGNLHRVGSTTRRVLGQD